MRRRKLGLKAWDDATRDGLWERLHGLMEAAKPDYTVFWRQLAACADADLLAAAAEGAEAELHDGASDGRRREWVARRLIRAEGAIQARVRGAEPPSDEPLLRVAEVDETALRAELAAGLDEPPPPWALVAYRPREHVDS